MWNKSEEQVQVHINKDLNKEEMWLKYEIRKKARKETEKVTYISKNRTTENNHPETPMEMEQRQEHSRKRPKKGARNIVSQTKQ